MENLKDLDPTNTHDALLSHLLTVVRRQVSTEHTLRNLKKLSPWKLHRVLVLAHRYLNPVEWKSFHEKMGFLTERGISLHRMSFKLPFGSAPRART